MRPETHQSQIACLACTNVANTARCDSDGKFFTQFFKRQNIFSLSHSIPFYSSSYTRFSLAHVLHTCVYLCGGNIFTEVSECVRVFGGGDVGVLLERTLLSAQ